MSRIFTAAAATVPTHATITLILLIAAPDGGFAFVVAKPQT
jgi:hypothetical protein